LAVIGTITCLVVIWKIPESFRVLLLNGELEESKKIVEKLLAEQKKPKMTHL